jgi:hypothetical protein
MDTLANLAKSLVEQSQDSNNTDKKLLALIEVLIKRIDLLEARVEMLSNLING